MRNSNAIPPEHKSPVVCISGLVAGFGELAVELGKLRRFDGQESHAQAQACKSFIVVRDAYRDLRTRSDRIQRVSGSRFG